MKQRGEPHSDIHVQKPRGQQELMLKEWQEGLCGQSQVRRAEKEMRFQWAPGMLRTWQMGKLQANSEQR